jgi:hypothetical protein
MPKFYQPFINPLTVFRGTPYNMYMLYTDYF